MGGKIMQDLGKMLIMPKGDYNASTAYEIIDVVNYDGASWICKKDCTGQTPTATNSEYWQYFGVAVDLSEIQSTSIGVLDTEGWYRVAEYPKPTENAGRGISSNGCTLIIKQRYSSQDGEYHELKLISVFNKQEIKSVASKCSVGARNVTKARYTFDSEKAYLEIYYCRSTANSIFFEVSHPKDKSSMWKAITPVATDELVEGVTVTTTYTIPSNVTPVNNLDIEQAKEDIRNAVTATLSKAGWYRVAEYEAPFASEIILNGNGANSCTLTIKRNVNADANEYEMLRLRSVGYSKQEFVLLDGKSIVQRISKVRYTHDGATKAYIEIYYNADSSNEVHFAITDAMDRWGTWKAITPTLTSETVDGVTVTTTYDIPANASPFTTNGGTLESSSREILKLNNTTGNGNGIGFYNQGTKIGELIVGANGIRFNDANDNANILLHTGNKPTGSYTGNGSAETRTINVGGLSVAKCYCCYVTNANGVAFVDHRHAVVISGNGVTILPKNQAYFESGEMVLNTDNNVLNGSGHTTGYIVL